MLPEDINMFYILEPTYQDVFYFIYKTHTTY